MKLKDCKFMSAKKFLNKNVYEASVERVSIIFKNFEKIYLSFSGGKDSGVMLNLVVDYMKKHKITKKIGILFIDLEGQYNITIDYIKSTLEKDRDLFEVYWCCLPLNLRNSLSVFEPFWTCWDLDNRDKWIREYPDFPFSKKIWNLRNLLRNLGYGMQAIRKRLV